MSLFGNTGANTQSQTPLFGNAATNQTQQADASSVFGSFAKPPQSTSAFGSATAATQPSTSGGLFGTAAPSLSQPQPSSSLFGTATTSQPQPSGSLFGSATATASQPQTSGGLFGGPLGGQQQQQSQPQQTSSLFGGTLGQNQNAQTSSNLFGNTTSQPKPTLSLFGNAASNQQQQTQQKPSLFGTSTSTNQQQQQPSLFGSTMRPGGLTLGQSTAQQQAGANSSQNTIPGVRIDISNVRGTTRFNDLHDDLQNQIMQIDTFIQQQISYQEQCAALMPSHAENVASVPSDVDYIKQKLDTTELALDNDSSSIEQMKSIVRQDAEDARLSFKATENLKLPQQFHHASWHGGGLAGGNTSQSSGGAGATPSEDIVAYFTKTAEDFQKTLDSYTRSISDIEAHLRTVETNVVQQSQQMLFRRGTNGGARDKDEQVRELVAVLNEFERAIVGVAERIGEARESASGVIEGERGGNGDGVRWKR